MNSMWCVRLFRVSILPSAQSQTIKCLQRDLRAKKVDETNCRQYVRVCDLNGRDFEWCMRVYHMLAQHIYVACYLCYVVCEASMLTLYVIQFGCDCHNTLMIITWRGVLWSRVVVVIVGWWFCTRMHCAYYVQTQHVAHVGSYRLLCDRWC